jgi:tetratricopeptide (TPR) repeat protein
MVVAFAGRRAQSLDGDLGAVELRIRRLLNALSPSAVVGALADGSDLLVAEAALGMTQRPRIEVILPTAEGDFREASVEPDWHERFDRVLQEIRIRPRANIESLLLEDGAEAYRRANRAFLDRASTLASDAERVVVVVVAGKGEGEIVEDLLADARLRNIPTLRIDPTVDITKRPRAFVAMPYGKKADGQRKIEVDCDLVYTKILVPALEDAQLHFRRADEEIDSGIVLQPMIEWLADAELVIGDLQTANFNVGWELGLRHLLRSHTTLLIRPSGTTAPFDLNSLRHVVYESDESGVSDAAAIKAWARLSEHLRTIGDQSDRGDSPVDALMEVAQWGVVRPRRTPDARWQQLRERLEGAREAAAGDLVLEVIDDAQGLEPDALAPLQREAGIGLVQLGRYEDARGLLRNEVERDPEVLHPEAHVYYAQALYRPADAGVEAYDAAERVLRRVLVMRSTHPEVRAMLGALAKRRMRTRGSAEAREPDIRLALEMYRHDYERDLNAYYEGINVVALATVLALVYADEREGRRARELVPAVRVAASLARSASLDDDYWAAATLAECVLYESLLDLGDSPIADSYRAVGAMRPGAAALESTLFQLDFLQLLGLPTGPLASARDALRAAAGTTLGGSK